jgi:exopolysaccharide biosynthesis protein
MTLKELAKYMKKLGAVDAMNLDGGGSTTFFLMGKVLNSPSDGRERPVSQALVIKPRSAPGGELTATAAGAAPGHVR